jgi:hypothetical protein
MRGEPLHLTLLFPEGRGDSVTCRGGEFLNQVECAVSVDKSCLIGMRISPFL